MRHAPLRLAAVLAILVPIGAATAQKPPPLGGNAPGGPTGGPTGGSTGGASGGPTGSDSAGAVPAPRLQPRPQAMPGKPPPLGADAQPAPRPDRAPRGGTAEFGNPDDKPAPLPPGSGGSGGGGNNGRLRAVSSGTGFVVAPGRLLTNNHVANGCTELRARTGSGQELRATVAALDGGHDLALLNVQGDAGPPLVFRRGPDIRRGESVITYGFPLAGLLSSGPTLTTGDVSALSGLADNPNQIQISAPVQPGNSGGPLLDLEAHVVGVVTAKLNAERVAQRTGDIPQNVNFAIRASTALDFLRGNGVQPRLADTDNALRSPAEVGEVADKSTLFLRCLR